jgi:aryl-alcohol dehydrogenase-like predicted oxidoreductase
VVKAGKVRYIGASSMFAWQFARAQYTADLNGWTRFVSMQNHYNLLYREEEREMNPFCVDQGVGLIPWSPLARGYLTGSRTREGSTTVRSQSDSFGERLYGDEWLFDVVDQVRNVAEGRGISMAQVALAWMLGKPGLAAPIIGTTKLKHLEDAVGAVGVALSDEEVQALESAYQPRPVLGHN